MFLKVLVCLLNILKSSGGILMTFSGNVDSDNS